MNTNLTVDQATLPRQEIASDSNVPLIEMGLGDDVMMCASVGRNVLLPSKWLNNEKAMEFAKIAEDILAPALSAVTSTPWLITSTDVDLWDRPRDKSEAHLNHRAFDMAPCFSETEILSHDRQMMGLAWNLLSLCWLGSLDLSRAAVVVEGDHLHVVVSEFDLTKRPQDCIFTVWSWASYYRLSGRLDDNQIMKKLKGSPGLFNYANLSYSGPSKQLTKDLLAYLGGLPNAYGWTGK